MKKRARSLVGDPDGDFCTDSYLLPLINQALDESINYLEGTCSPFIEEVRDAPGLAAGTTSLVAQQKNGGPLVGLMNPLFIEVKQAGQPDTQYREVVRADRLPNVNPNGQAPYETAFWEWRSYLVYLTPLSYPADFRVRGEFRPAPLLKDEDIITIHPLLVPALAYATATLVGMERGNQNFVQNYGPKSTSTLDDIAAELVRQQQGTSSRVGKMNGRSGRRR